MRFFSFSFHVFKVHRIQNGIRVSKNLDPDPDANDFKSYQHRHCWCWPCTGTNLRQTVVRAMAWYHSSPGTTPPVEYTKHTISIINS